MPPLPSPNQVPRSPGIARPAFWPLRCALATLCLAGCAAVGPDFKPETPAAPPDFGAWHGGAPELAVPAGPVSGAPLNWAMFRDPVLEQLQARALQANADLQTAALRFAQSRAQRRIVDSLQAPQVGLQASVTEVRASEYGDFTRVLDALNAPNKEEVIQVLSDPYGLYQAGFDAVWEIDVWGRVRRSIEAADANVAAAQALLAQAQLSVQAEVARGYFELRGAQRQIELTRADLQAADETLQLVKARAAGGMTTDLDVVRQAALTADLRSRLPALLAQDARTLNVLSLLLGERPGSLAQTLAAPVAQAQALPDLSLGLPSEMALRRPDIQRAQAQLHTATAEVGVAVADLYPRITIGASFGFVSAGAGNFGEWGSRQWSIGPNLQLPVFDQGRRKATITLRKLQQQEAAVSYQQTVLKAWHEIDDALSAYNAERARNLQLAAKERDSRDALTLARARYDAGMTDFLVPLDAERTLLQARREHADSSARLALSLVAVSKALAASPPPTAPTIPMAGAG